MQASGKWISYSDLADMLEQDVQRGAIISDFILNQLHALIRAPFELLSGYCTDYDKQEPTRGLTKELHGTDWYEFARVVRNAVSHNFRFHFSKHDRRRLPIMWHGIMLTEELDGKAVTYEVFWHRPGYELFLEMRAFAEMLPELPTSTAQL